MPKAVRLWSVGWGEGEPHVALCDDHPRIAYTLPTDKFKAGLLFNPNAWWIGFHWSPTNKRLCVNLVPTLTVWVRWPGGMEP